MSGGSRRPHSKTRNGCRQCKRRRVKVGLCEIVAIKCRSIDSISAMQNHLAVATVRGEVKHVNILICCKLPIQMLLHLHRQLSPYHPSKKIYQILPILSIIDMFKQDFFKGCSDPTEFDNSFAIARARVNAPLVHQHLFDHRQTSIT